jgi:methionyl-tRNA formyltransferase
MKPLNIVFAGTPAFTLPCLNALASSGHHLQAVYTQPDRPAGRGRSLQASPVKTWAMEHALPVYQPLNFKDPQTVADLATLSPDIIVVIAYGLILPQAVLDIPRLGCINVHASLLPRWRGASPIQQAILHGDRETGITIMQLDAGMDTGAMLTRIPCPIQPDDTAERLHDRLAKLAAKPLLHTLDLLASDQVIAESQDNTLATHAPKIKKEDAAINWHQRATEIERQIRAFNPWPITWTQMDGQILRIYKAREIKHASKDIPGTILSLDKQGMLVVTGENALFIETIQFPGGKALSIADWLNAGRTRLHAGLVLGSPD